MPVAGNPWDELQCDQTHDVNDADHDENVAVSILNPDPDQQSRDGITQRSAQPDTTKIPARSLNPFKAEVVLEWNDWKVEKRHQDDDRGYLPEDGCGVVEQNRQRCPGKQDHQDDILAAGPVAGQSPERLEGQRDQSRKRNAQADLGFTQADAVQVKIDIGRIGCLAGIIQDIEHKDGDWKRVFFHGWPNPPLWISGPLSMLPI